VSHSHYIPWRLTPCLKKAKILDNVRQQQGRPTLKALRRARADAGLTISELAKRSGVSRDTISNAEKGQHSLQATSLSKIARALGRAPSELLAEEEKLAPKAESRSSLEPSFNDVLDDGRRPRYLNAWRAFVWKLAQRWEEEPPETSREIAVVLDTMQALVDEGAFEQPGEQVTASSWLEASEGVELKLLFLGLQRLNAIADTVKGDETAQRRRELLQALPGGLSA
jgi:transcriptional regulator with XRE-family HTH domain